jgi:hypothetical protein
MLDANLGGNRFESWLRLRWWEQPDNLCVLGWDCGWNQDGAGHTAVQHIDLPGVVRVGSEVDSVDREGLEPGRLNAQ